MAVLTKAATGAGTGGNLYTNAINVSTNNSVRATWSVTRNNSTVHYWALPAFTEIPAGDQIDQIRVYVDHAVSPTGTNFNTRWSLRSGTTLVSNETQAITLNTTADSLQNNFFLTGVSTAQLRAGLQLGMVATRSVNTTTTHSIDFIAVEVTHSTPPPPAIVADSFGRTANASSLGTADTGQAWRADQGTFGINASGQAQRYSAVNNDIATVYVGETEMEVSFTMVNLGVGDGYQGAVGNYTDLTSFNYVEATPTGAVFIVSVKNSVYTARASTADGAAKAGDKITGRFSASGVTAYVNDVQVQSWTDVAPLATGVRAGWRPGGGAILLIDNFYARPLSIAPYNPWYVWTGTVEQPLTLAGTWNGSALVTTTHTLT